MEAESPGAGPHRAAARSQLESRGSTESKKSAGGSWINGNDKTLEPQIGADERRFLNL